jgi:hypothetical protein
MAPPVDAFDLYPLKEFVRVENLRGRELTRPIAKVDRREVKKEKDGEEYWDVEGLIFLDLSPELVKARFPKKIALNATNRKALETMFGTKDIQKSWVGKRITLGSRSDFRPDVLRNAPCLRIVGSPDIEESMSFEITKRVGFKTIKVSHQLTRTVTKDQAPPVTEPAPAREYVNQAISGLEVSPTLDALKETAADVSKSKPWTPAQRKEIGAAVNKRRKELEAEAAIGVPDESPDEEPGGEE